MGFYYLIQIKIDWLIDWLASDNWQRRKRYPKRRKRGKYISPVNADCWLLLNKGKNSEKHEKRRKISDSSAVDKAVKHRSNKRRTKFCKDCCFIRWYRALILHLCRTSLMHLAYTKARSAQLQWKHSYWPGGLWNRRCLSVVHAMPVFSNGTSIRWEPV